MIIWALLIGLMTAGMVLGLVMMWRQRNHLRSVAGMQFEDDAWGFGQVAALFIWAPIPVEFLYIFLDR
jgi:hydrogenase-4 membrane subunit HyfE